MFRTIHYREGEHAPQPGGEHNWHVWCGTGALYVLKQREYVEKLSQEPDAFYTVNFANCAHAVIDRSNPLWQELRQISQHYLVEVIHSYWLDAKYVIWTINVNDDHTFNSIKISNRPKMQ